MMRLLCYLCLLCLLGEPVLLAQNVSRTGRLQVVSLPVECDIQITSQGMDWAKKKTERWDSGELPAGTYEVCVRYQGRTLKQSAQVERGKTTMVTFNFLQRDLSEVPADSPAQQALKLLNQAQEDQQKNQLAQAWQSIELANKLYADDPEIHTVYNDIAEQRNRRINTIWSELTKAQQARDRPQTLALLASLHELAPNHPSAGQVQQQMGVTFNKLGMMMVRMQRGQFIMGCMQSIDQMEKFARNSKAWTARESPTHPVTFSRSFMMASTPVTRGQFARFVEATNYVTEAQNGRFAAGLGERGLGRKDGLSWKQLDFEQTDDHPVVCVSWNDAIAFCQWMTTQEGRTYRLPTEAQWEYACRAGTSTMFWWGDDLNRKQHNVNIYDQSLVNWQLEHFKGRQGRAAWDDGFAFTSPVGSFPANPWGLHDMHGNVSQWCLDWEAPYNEGSTSDPIGPPAGKNRIVRGGSWYYQPLYCRSSSRSGYRPDRSYTNIGFRVIYEER